MIPLEQQVTSLELSKRLKELGVKQDSLFAWYQSCGGVYCEHRVHQASRDAQSTYHDGYVELPVEICAAFTVAELGEMLPYDVHSYKSSKVDKWVCNDNCGMLMLRKTEADARARMLIWRRENKLL